MSACTQRHECAGALDQFSATAFVPLRASGKRTSLMMIPRMLCGSIAQERATVTHTQERATVTHTQERATVTHTQERATVTHTQERATVTYTRVRLTKCSRRVAEILLHTNRAVTCQYIQYCDCDSQANRITQCWGWTDDMLRTHDCHRTSIELSKYRGRVV
jgi:hypothetical protein